MPPLRIRFGAYLLDEARYVLERDGVPVALRPKAFDLLVHLARHRDRVVRRDEAIEIVWGRTRVGAGSLVGLVNELRSALGDRGRGSWLIRTVHARGYQFVAEAREARRTPPSPAERSDAVESLARATAEEASAVGPVGVLVGTASSAPPRTGSGERDRVHDAPGTDAPAPTDGFVERFVRECERRGFEALRVDARDARPMTPGRLAVALVAQLRARRGAEQLSHALPPPARHWLARPVVEPVARGEAKPGPGLPGGLSTAASTCAHCARSAPLVVVVEAIDRADASLPGALALFFRGLGSAPVVVLATASRGMRDAHRRALAEGMGFRPVDASGCTAGASDPHRLLDDWRQSWGLDPLARGVEWALLAHLERGRVLTVPEDPSLPARPGPRRVDPARDVQPAARPARR